MTIGEALERAEQLRPNCRIETETRLQWLREADALLRTKLFDRAAAGAFDAVGADRPWEQPVQDDQTLLAPPPFDALYPHLLCAQMDAALGETDRYAGEQAQYNALYAELAVWLRQNYPPRSGRSGAGKEVRRWYWQTEYGLPTPGSCCGPLAA